MIQPKQSIIDAKGYEPPLFLEECLMKLDLNENPFGPSPEVVKALKNVTMQEIQYYPAYGELINKIAEVNGIEPLMILPTNGADEAINYVFNTFIEKEDSVINITPAFAMPDVYAKCTGCDYKRVNYNGKWSFPVDEYLENIDGKTKLVVVTTPNSPTGDAISRNDLIKILEKAKHCPVLIDETYSAYAKERFTDLVEKYENAVIVRSMSKDYGLAGLRLGYIISNRTNIDYIRRIASPYSVNSMAVKAGIAALTDQAYFDSVKARIDESRKILSEGLKDLAVSVYASETNFILVDFGERADYVYKKLYNAGIMVKYYKNDSQLKGCFRITLPSPENARLFLDVLKPRELVIFDIDGVLVDVTNSYREAIKKTYEHFTSRSLSAEEIQNAKNLGGLNNDWDLTEFLIQKAGFSIPKEQIIDRFQEFYFGNDGDGFILNEEFLISPETLKELGKRYDLAIFTGRPRKEAEFVLKRWNLENLFLHIIAMEDVPDGFHKPDPWGINKIREIIKSQQVYYFGDTPDDMISATGAGVKGFGVLPPQDKSDSLKSRLLQEGAVVVLDTVEKAVEILAQIKDENYA